MIFFFVFKHKTAYEMRISDWSSDVCSSDLVIAVQPIIRRTCEAVGAVVDIEQNRIVERRSFPDQPADIGHLKRDARIIQDAADDVRERPPRPVYDRRYKLGDADRGILT